MLPALVFISDQASHVERRRGCSLPPNPALLLSSSLSLRHPKRCGCCSGMCCGRAALCKIDTVGVLRVYRERGVSAHPPCPPAPQLRHLIGIVRSSTFAAGLSLSFSNAVGVKSATWWQTARSTFINRSDGIQLCCHRLWNCLHFNAELPTRKSQENAQTKVQVYLQGGNPWDTTHALRPARCAG
jgi:hypothetical protein